MRNWGWTQQRCARGLDTRPAKRRRGLTAVRRAWPDFEPTRHTSATQRHRCGGHRRDRRAWPRCWWAAAGPGRTTSRRATHQRPGATGVEGAGGSGGHGRASRSTTPSEARVWRSRGRPGPTAPGTPAATQATQTRGSPPGPPRVPATISHSTPSSGQPLSAVERPRPRQPGRRSGQRPCAGCHQRQPG